MLRELLINENKLPQLFEYAEKCMNDNQVSVKVQFGAPKHGTELTMMKENPLDGYYYDEQIRITRKTDDIANSYKSGLGNICVGEIVEKGSQVSSFSVGDRVAFYGHLRNTHIVNSENLYLLPEGMSWKAAVCFDPLQFALGGIRDSNMKIGDTVLISGLGAIGLMAAQAAKLAGASFVAVADPIEKRRKAALENGADIAFDPIKEDFGLQLREIIGGRGIDAVIETSGNYKALEQSLRALAYMGNIALVGWFKECSIPFTLGKEGHFNSQNIYFSRACSEPNREYPRWNFARICDAAWSILTKNKINCENIVDPVVEFSQSDVAYKKYIIDDPELSVKLGVDFLN